MEFQLDIEAEHCQMEPIDWLQEKLQSFTGGEQDFRSARIVVRERNLGWYVEAIVYGANTVMAADAGRASLDDTVRRVFRKLTNSQLDADSCAIDP